MSELGRILLILGGALLVVGVLFLAAGRLGLGRLPGGLRHPARKHELLFPLATSILLSLLITLLLWIAGRR